MKTRPALAFSPGAAGPVLTREVIVPLPAISRADDLSWQDRALCAETDPEEFFPGKGGSTRAAKRVCRGCPVKFECLEYALANDERFGVWGGFSERERRRLKPASPVSRDAAEATEPVPELTAAEVDRFYARLAPGGCGVRWAGDAIAAGYGRLAVYRDGRRVWVMAHRLAYQLATGEDPAGIAVRQECGIPWCCTPGCLLPGVPGSRARTGERAA